jgi:serine phosphatase RsbU (regulator of sigma subunit)/pSer/pThr/pTyr-binding forkhead associated (FHA) protein
MDPRILIVTGDQELGASLLQAARRLGSGAALLPPERLGDAAAGGAAIADLRLGSEVLARVAGLFPRWILAGDRSRPGDVLEAWRAGARDFLPRDFRDDELAAALGRVEDGGEASAFLEIQDKDGATRRVRITGQTFSLGRDASSDLCFNAAAVSRYHATIVRQGTRHHLRDRSSRHGTFLNGKQITEGPLADGDHIRLGGEGAPILTYIGPAPVAPPEDPSQRARATDMEALPSQEMKDIASLLDTFLTLNSGLLLDDVLRIVVTRSVELAGAERGMILLAAAEDGGGPDAGVNEEKPAAEARGGLELRLALALEKSGAPIAEEALAISRKIPEQVMATSKGVIFQDLLAPDEIDAHPSTIQIGVRSAMCVPLRAPRREGGPAVPPLGVLYVDSTSSAQPFSERRLNALESLATEAAEAIANARLYEESLEKRQLDEEMRIARAIQRSFLPPSSFANPWLDLHGTSEASREVGGDLLDYYPFDEGRVGLVVGDVSGKGVPAAMCSSLIDGLCYGLAARAGSAEDLARMAQEINRHLAAKSLGKFVSLIFGVLDASGRFAYFNAGHLPPLRIRSDGSVETLRSSGMVLGFFEEAEYTAGETQVASGDLLVFYSDGITEARSPERELFGVARLRDQAVRNRTRSSREIHGAILSTLARFTRGAPAADDTTLMVARFKGR